MAVGVYGSLGVASASNAPGAHADPKSWYDASNGRVYVFGGKGKAESGGTGHLNDLWYFDTNTGHWTWHSGSKNINQNGVYSVFNKLNATFTHLIMAVGVYGSLGSASASNAPGGREAGTSWYDSSNRRLYVFGGDGFGESGSSGFLNDLWSYDMDTGHWTWHSGSKTTNQNGRRSKKQF